VQFLHFFVVIVFFCVVFQNVSLSGYINLNLNPKNRINITSQSYSFPVPNAIKQKTWLAVGACLFFTNTRNFYSFASGKIPNYTTVWVCMCRDGRRVLPTTHNTIMVVCACALIRIGIENLVSFGESVRNFLLDFSFVPE
jgi:hypothetical protein